jgi:Spy/CpxP family protein refolding chaperone
MTILRSSAAAGLALMLAVGAAQAQQPTTPPARPDARVEGPMMRGQRGPRGEMGPGRALFRGIELTAQQKEQMRAIAGKYQTQTKSLRESTRPAMEEARAARQRGDTVAARKAWERTTAQRQQMVALQERQMTELRGILTADQQRTFDANRTAVKARMDERRAEGGRQGGRQGGRRGEGRNERRGFRGRAG